MVRDRDEKTVQSQSIYFKAVPDQVFIAGLLCRLVEGGEVVDFVGRDVQNKIADRCAIADVRVNPVIRYRSILRTYANDVVSLVPQKLAEIYAILSMTADY
jgi:hypothetical protein